MVEDRLLALLLPNLIPDILAFYKSGGPAMSGIFREHQLQSIDRSLIQDLNQLLKTLLRPEAERDRA